MEEKSIRINKYLADAGICSRREADRLVGMGLVKINGVVAESGTKVGMGDKVTLRDKSVLINSDIHVLAYYKPVGVTCTQKDVYAKKVVTKEIKYPVRITYAGRLDKASEGLLLMTNDGGLIDRLMRAANQHEKEYVVKVDKEISPDFLRKMGEGVYLEELKTTTRPCRLEALGKYTFSIVLTQGLNRQIRRMCQVFGYEIRSLKRIRINNVTLGKLRPGEYRRLEGEELQKLYEGL